MKVRSLFELDNIFWNDDLYGSFVEFCENDLNQFSERVLDGDIRGHMIFLGIGKNLGASLQLTAGGKIIAIKCEPIK